MFRVNVVSDTGSSFSLEISPNSTILQLKTSLVNHTGYSEESMVLTYISRLLQDRDTVRSVGLRASDTLHLFVRIPAEFEVFVCPPSGQLLRVTLGVTDTAADLLQKVKDLILVRASMQLLYDRKPLPQDVPLVSLKLGLEPQFKLWPKPPVT